MNCKINEQTVVNKCAEVAQQVHEDFINGKTYTPEMEEIKNKTIADGTFMKAPNGNPTNLTERQWLQVRTKAFKDWFGDWGKGLQVEQDNNSYYRGQYEEPIIDKEGNLILRGRKDPLYDRAAYNIEKGVSATTDIKSADEYGVNQRYAYEADVEDKYGELDQSWEKEQELNEVAKHGYYLIQFPKNISNQVINEAGEVKIVGDVIIPKGQYTIEHITDDGTETIATAANNASKVIDENGEPLVVYHGSDENWNIFDKNAEIKHGRAFGQGFYASSLKDVSNWGKYTKEIFLNIRNPLVNNNISDKTVKRNLNEAIMEDGETGFTGKPITKVLVNAGYDGRIDTFEYTSMPKQTHYVVFNSNQIKSATDNIGEFSKENDDIRYNKEKQKDVLNFIKKHLFGLRLIQPTRETKEKHKVVHKYLNDENEIWLTKFLNDENEKGDIQYDANLSEKAIEDFIKEKGLSYWFRVKQVYKFGTTKLIGKKLVFDKEGLNDDILEHSDINDIVTETGEKYNLSLLGFLEKRLGVPFKSITQKEAKELLKDKYNSSINAFNLNGTAYFIKGRKINADIKSEEMLHPFIASMHKNNPEVFSDLLEDAKKLFPQLHIDILNTYPEGEVDEELVTQALARVFVEEKKKNSIPRTMQNFIDKFKKWVVSIFTKNPELKLNDFTLQDIAELINSDIEISYEKTFGLNLNKSAENKQTQQSFDKSSAEFYSGAANGSDQEWAQQAKGLGIKVKDYTVDDWDKLSQEWKNKLDAEYRDVVNILGRKVLDPNSYSGKLVRRDMMQADKADAIFAIGTIASNGYVDGGTGYATTRGIQRGIPVYVFDQSDNQWKVWNNDSKSFVVTQEPTLTLHAATIGTREINDNGKHAIRDILAKTTNNSVVQQQTEQVQQQQDKSPVVDGDSYGFNNKKEADEFERRLNEMFPLPNNESITYRVNDTTVILKRIFDVVRIYDLKSNIGKRSFKANTENATETTKSYNTIVGNENNKRLLSNLRSQLKNTEALLNNYFKKYNNPNANKLERAEVIRNYKILSLQRDYIEKALYNLDIFDTDSIVKNVDNILEMFERIYNGVLNTHDAYNSLYDITDPVIMSVFRDLHNLANSFFEKYGQEGNQQLNKINDRELIEKIDEQIKKWIDYKNKYNQLTKQIIDKILDMAEGMRRGSNFKTGLRAHWRANFDKQLRQGLKDLGFGQTFFAFDNAMKENTAIPKILTMLTEKVDIECFNEFFEINKRFDVVIDKLRSIGVNLNDKKSWGEYFIERFKNGTETGNLISCFTPEFRMFMSKFFNTNPKSFINITQEDEKLQRKKLRQFIDTLDVVNIFKLKEAHNPNHILYKMLEVLSRNVVRENFGDDGSTIGFDFYGKQWSELSQQPEYAYDEEYENEIKKKLGPDFNRVITQYINLFTQTFEQRDENFDVMRNNVTMENNPFYIMKHLVDSKRTNNDSNVTGPNHAFYNYNKMIYIPSDSKYYNQQFAEMFNESNPNRDVFSEAYNLFMEIYGDMVGSMYFSDANNTAYAKIVYDGILRSNHKGFINMVKKLWDDLRSTFLRDKVVEKDPTKINKNYSDEYRAIYNKIYSSLAGMSASQILIMAADWGIDTYEINNEEVNTIRSIVANEITSRQSDFDTDFVKSTKNILRLYAVQKKNNIMTEYATAMRDKFAEFKINPNANDGPENTRVKALESYDDQVSRGFKQQGRPKHAKKISEDEVERIKNEIKDSLKNGLDVDTQIESLIKAHKRHLMSNEKKIVEKLIDILQSASNVANYDHSFSFIYKEKEYSFFIDNRYGKQYRRNGKAITPEEFVDAREEYIMEKILDFGSECGLDSVVDGISTITRLKMLGGYVSALIPGFKNRVDGLVADADLDATWRYFTPGNLAWAQRFLWGSMLPIGLVNNEGGMLIKGFSKGSAKRFQITKIIGDRLRVFQDMSNTLDKNTSKTISSGDNKNLGVNIFSTIFNPQRIRKNLNPYNIAIQFPEIRNQFDLLIAILHDYTVKDKDGKEHRFVDTIKGVMCYTMLDVDKNGNLFLKDEFNPDLYEEGTPEYENTKNNKQWITFDTEMESSSKTRRMTGKKDLSDVSRISIDHMNANKRANGDYREALKKLYSKNTFWRMVMNLKTFAPERFKRAWSQGNNEDLIGEYTTLWEYGGLMSWGTIVYNAFQSASEKYNLSRSHILPRRLTAMAVGLTNATVAVGMMTVMKKAKPNIKLYHRVLFDLKYLKSLLYEQITFLPRFAGMKTNPVKFTFKDNDKIFKENEVIPQVNETTEEVLYREEKMEDEIRMHKGNVAALARSVARSTYGLAFKVALVYVGTKVIKGMFGGDDDDTEYNKKKNIDPKVNFLVNTLKNVSESCSLLYQMSFGVMDMYKSVVMFSLIEKITDGIQKMHDLEYEEGAEKLGEVAFPMRATLWKKFSSDYKGRETDWAMAAEALDEENLDEEGYYDKYFEKKNRQLKKKLKDAYMEVFEEGKKEYDAKKKEGESFDAHYLKDGFSSDEMNDIENFFRKKNKKARENKIEIGDDWSLYDLNEDQFKKLIDSFLPRNDGKTEDLYGNKHKTTNRRMIQTYKEWFRNSESLKKPLALEAFDENPSFLMDIVRLINDGKDTEENTNIKNLNNERAERERRLREAGL